MDERRGFLQRKAYLRIGGEVDAAALSAIAAFGDDVTARAIAEIRRPLYRPLGQLRGNIHSRPRGQAAGDVQSFQEALGDWIGLAAGQPPRPRRRVETLDRHHIRYAEAREGITHIAFADEAAQIRELCRQCLDRFALAAERIVDVVEQDRAGDLYFDRFGEG